MMAWAILSRPGTKYGPCKKECKHVDCAETRRQAAALCGYCGKPIGYGYKFSETPDKGFAHWLCEPEPVRRTAGGT